MPDERNMSTHKKPDPRLNPWRDDLAAAYLRGEVDAPKYVEGRDMMVISPVAALRRSPADGAKMDTQLLHGEIFRVYEKKKGWAWGQSQRDDYVGYAKLVDLAGPVRTDMVVTAMRSFVYESDDIKSRPVMALSMGAQVKMVSKQGRFVHIDGDGWMIADHLGYNTEHDVDFVSIAEKFLHVPYLWGGKESLGLDCSALVQIALQRCGISCPRDSDMQERVLGETVEPDAPLQRGDLVFWKGHVGIMQDATRLLHANATHMKVVSEPFQEARSRIAETEGDITSIKRLNGLSA
ncbi:MAG: NlpC/P60 family protein [Parvibaculales bacterium]